MQDEHLVDGVPLLTSPAAGGQCAGGLVFRVGHADETLPTRGITHLVEHLALSFADLPTLHANGQTGFSLTHIHVSGTVDEVVTFLNTAVASLSDLPLARLEVEKSILRTEESQRPWGPAPSMGPWRYGAQGYGLSGYPEWGLSRITADDVRSWASAWFTRENAVAWITHPTVPAGLKLELPEGERRPLPPVTSALPQAPAWYRGRDGVIVQESIVRRSTAATTYAGVLDQALFRDLRKLGGYSYTATASYDPRDEQHASIWALADSLPEKQDAVVGGFVDALARLRLGHIDPQDVAASVARARTSLAHPDAEAFRLPGRASDHLLGHRRSTTDELLAELDAVDVDSVRAVAVEAHSTALVQVPGGGLDWAGYVEAPANSEDVVEGNLTRFHGDSDSGLIVGDEGISLTAPNRRSTVRWTEVSAVQAFPDGGRVVLGRDGFQVVVEPTMLAQEEAVVSAIDRHVSSDLVVTMPPREPDAIPTPAPVDPPPFVEPSRTAAAPSERRTRWRGRKKR